MFQLLQQGQAHLYGWQAVGIGKANPTGHARMRAIRANDDLGLYTNMISSGCRQHNTAALPAFTLKNAVPKQNMGSGIRSGAGKSLIKFIPVNDVTRGRHVLNAVAVQITAHAQRGLGDIIFAHVSLPHQHGRDIFGAPHGQPHHTATLDQGHRRSGLCSGPCGAGTSRPGTHNQNVILQHAHAPFPLVPRRMHYFAPASGQPVARPVQQP